MSHPFYNPYVSGNQSSTQASYGLSSMQAEGTASPHFGPRSNSFAASSETPGLMGPSLLTPPVSYRPEQSRAKKDKDIERTVDLHISRAREDGTFVVKQDHLPVGQSAHFANTREIVSSGTGTTSYLMSTTSAPAGRSGYKNSTADDSSKCYSSQASTNCTSSKRQRDGQSTPGDCDYRVSDKPDAAAETSCPKYNSEAATNILLQFGLEKNDLDYLITYPEDQMTPENLPFILRQIRTQKTERTATKTKPCPQPQPIRGETGMNGFRSSGGSSAVLQPTKVIDYGHSGNYAGGALDEIGRTSGRRANSGGSGHMSLVKSSHIQGLPQKDKAKEKGLGSSFGQGSAGTTSVLRSAASQCIDPAKPLKTQPNQTSRTILSSSSLSRKDKDASFRHEEPSKAHPLKKSEAGHKSASKTQTSSSLSWSVHPNRPGLVLLGASEAPGSKNSSTTLGKASAVAKQIKKQQPQQHPIQMSKKQVLKQPGTQMGKALWPPVVFATQPASRQSITTYPSGTVQPSGFRPHSISVPPAALLPARSQKNFLHSPTQHPAKLPGSNNLPTPAMMHDYAAATPRVFPHTCSLCFKEFTNMKDWISHQNSSLHLESCRVLRTKYPQWNGEVLLNPSAARKDAKPSSSASEQTSQQRHLETRHRGRSRSHSEGRREKRSRSLSSHSSRYSRSRSRSPRYDCDWSCSRSPDRQRRRDDSLSSPRRSHERLSSPRTRDDRWSSPRWSEERWSSPGRRENKWSSPRWSEERWSSPGRSHQRLSPPSRANERWLSPKRREDVWFSHRPPSPQSSPQRRLISAYRLGQIGQSDVQSLSKRVKPLNPASLAKQAKQTKGRKQLNLTPSAASSSAKRKTRVMTPTKGSLQKSDVYKPAPPTMVRLEGVANTVSHSEVVAAMEQFGKTKSVVLFRKKLEALVCFEKAEDAKKLKSLTSIEMKGISVSVVTQKNLQLKKIPLKKPVLSSVSTSQTSTSSITAVLPTPGTTSQDSSRAKAQQILQVTSGSSDSAVSQQLLTIGDKVIKHLCPSKTKNFTKNRQWRRNNVNARAEAQPPPSKPSQNGQEPVGQTSARDSAKPTASIACEDVPAESAAGDTTIEDGEKPGTEIVLDDTTCPQSGEETVVKMEEGSTTEDPPTEPLQTERDAFRAKEGQEDFSDDELASDVVDEQKFNMSDFVTLDEIADDVEEVSPVPHSCSSSKPSSTGTKTEQSSGTSSAPTQASTRSLKDSKGSASASSKSTKEYVKRNSSSVSTSPASSSASFLSLETSRHKAQQSKTKSSRCGIRSPTCEKQKMLSAAAAAAAASVVCLPVSQREAAREGVLAQSRHRVSGGFAAKTVESETKIEKSSEMHPPAQGRRFGLNQDLNVETDIKENKSESYKNQEENNEVSVQVLGTDREEEEESTSAESCKPSKDEEQTLKVCDNKDSDVTKTADKLDSIDHQTTMEHNGQKTEALSDQMVVDPVEDQPTATDTESDNKKPDTTSRRHGRPSRRSGLRTRASKSEETVKSPGKQDRTSETPPDATARLPEQDTEEDKVYEIVDSIEEDLVQDATGRTDRRSGRGQKEDKMTLSLTEAPEKSEEDEMPSYEILDSVEDETVTEEPSIMTRSTRGRRERTAKKDQRKKEDTPTRRRRTPARESQEKTPKKEKNLPTKKSVITVREEIDEDATYEILDSVEDEVLKDDPPPTRGKGKRGRPKKAVRTTRKDAVTLKDKDASEKETDEEKVSYQILDAVEDEMVEDQLPTNQSKTVRKKKTKQRASLAGLPQNEEEEPVYQIVDSVEDDQVQEELTTEVLETEMKETSQRAEDSCPKEDTATDLEASEKVVAKDLDHEGVATPEVEKNQKPSLTSALVNLDEVSDEEEDYPEDTAEEEELREKQLTMEEGRRKGEVEVDTKELVTLDEVGADEAGDVQIPAGELQRLITPDKTVEEVEKDVEAPPPIKDDQSGDSSPQTSKTLDEAYDDRTEMLDPVKLTSTPTEVVSKRKMDVVGPEAKRSRSLSPSVPADFKLPPFRANHPLGQEFVVPKSGYFCNICRVFYLSESSAKIVHCSSQAHYNNLQKHYLKLQQKLSTGSTPNSQKDV